MFVQFNWNTLVEDCVFVKRQPTGAGQIYVVQKMQALRPLPGCAVLRGANLMFSRKPLRLTTRLNYLRQQAACSSVSADK